MQNLRLKYYTSFVTLPFCKIWLTLLAKMLVFWRDCDIIIKTCLECLRGRLYAENKISRTSAYHASFPSDTSDGTVPAARRRNHRPEGLHLQRERQRGLGAYGYPLDPRPERPGHQ